MKLERVDFSRRRLIRVGFIAFEADYSISKQISLRTEWCKKTIGELYAAYLAAWNFYYGKKAFGRENYHHLVRCATNLLTKVMLQLGLVVDNDQLAYQSALYYTLGAYSEQEANLCKGCRKRQPNKADQWRDESFHQLYKHTEHEIQEVKKGLTAKKTAAYLIHNCTDLVGLSLILLAKRLEAEGVDFEERL